MDSWTGAPGLTELSRGAPDRPVAHQPIYAESLNLAKISPAPDKYCSRSGGAPDRPMGILVNWPISVFFSLAQQTVWWRVGLSDKGRRLPLISERLRALALFTVRWCTGLVLFTVWCTTRLCSFGSFFPIAI
jgi:hypothetical protein